MIINEDVSNNAYQIQAYSKGAITINHEIYQRSVLITPEQLITNWPPQELSELKPTHLDMLLPLKAEIFLFGTGQKFLIPQNFVRDFFNEHHLAFEFMDTHNACRTFMALSSEGRKVLAALLIK